jgi:hypothetical protein
MLSLQSLAADKMIDCLAVLKMTSLPRACDGLATVALMVAIAHSLS